MYVKSALKRITPILLICLFITSIPTAALAESGTAAAPIQGWVVNDRNQDGVAYYVVNGVRDNTFTGIAYNRENKRWEYVRNGAANYNFSGVATSIKDGNKYYVNKGVVDFTFNGIAQDREEGLWKYFRNSREYSKFTGIAVSVYDNKKYFVRNGVVDFTFTGVAKNPATGKWEYVRRGKEYPNYTGIAVSSYDGNNYFVRNGVCDFTFTGYAYNPTTKTWDYVKNGKADYTFEGAAKSVKNGEYYYAKNGQVDFTFTGLAKSADHGTYIYTKNGRHRINYTGASSSMTTTKYYHVVDGQWARTFTGTYSYKGGSYSVVRGGIKNSSVTIDNEKTYINSDGELNRDTISGEIKDSWVPRYMESLGFKWNDYLNSEYAFILPATISNYQPLRKYSPAITYGAWPMWMIDGMNIDKLGGDKGSYAATLNSFDGLVCTGFANFAYSIYWKYGENGKFAAASQKYRKALVDAEINNGHANLENMLSLIYAVDELEKAGLAKGYNVSSGKTVDDYPVAAGDMLGFKSHNGYKWHMNEHVGIYMGEHNGAHWMAHTSNSYNNISITTIEAYEAVSGFKLGTIVHFI